MKKALWIRSLILAALLVRAEAAEQCNFGTACMYPCRCADAAVCDRETGQCPGNCSPGWSGPYCRTGANVALGKRVTESSRPFAKALSLAVDGQRSEGGCAKIQERPAWWRVHLGGLYRIMRVVLFLGADEKGKPLDVLVSQDDEGDPVTCTRYDDERSLNPDRDGVVVFQCPRNAVGTSFVLYRTTPPLELCEVQITAEIVIETNAIEPILKFTTAGACDGICEGFMAGNATVPEECRAQCGLSDGTTGERASGIPSPVCITFIVTTCLLIVVTIGLLVHIHTQKKSARTDHIGMTGNPPRTPHHYVDQHKMPTGTNKPGGGKLSKKQSKDHKVNKYSAGLNHGVGAAGASAARPAAYDDFHYDDPNTLQGTAPEANYDSIDDPEGVCPLSIDVAYDGEDPSIMYDPVATMSTVIKQLPYTALSRKGVSAK